MFLTKKGLARSRRVPGVRENEKALALGIFQPSGFDTSVRHTMQERAALGCIQVVVTDYSCEYWEAQEQITGERLLGSKRDWPQPEDYAAFAAALLGGGLNLQ